MPSRDSWHANTCKYHECHLTNVKRPRWGRLYGPTSGEMSKYAQKLGRSEQSLIVRFFYSNDDLVRQQVKMSHLMQTKSWLMECAVTKVPFQGNVCSCQRRAAKSSSFVDFGLGETLMLKDKADCPHWVLLMHLHMDRYKIPDLTGTAHLFLAWYELVRTKNHQTKCAKTPANSGQ